MDKPDGLRGGNVSESKENLSEKGVSLSRLIPKGSVLVGCIGDIGNIAIAGCDLCTNQQINSITFETAKVDPEFGKYAVEISEGEHWRLSTLVVVSIIKKSKQGTITIPLPPHPEQKRIAAYLDASCAAIDRVVELKQKQLDTLGDLRKSVIQKAVTQGLNHDVEMKESGVDFIECVPCEWRVKRLKSLSTIRYGLGQPPELKDDGLPILRATNVKRGKISEVGLIRVDPDDLPLGRDPYLKAGEIIVVRSGAYTADSAIIPPEWEGSIAGYDMVVTARFTEAQFLAYALLSDYVLKDQLLLMTLRAAQPHLNANELGSVSIAIPASRGEQRIICDYLDKKLSELQSVRNCIHSQVTTLIDYRKSLIHECVTGKQRITAEDIAKVKAHV